MKSFLEFLHPFHLKRIFIKLLSQISSSYWFLPSLMTLCSIALSVISIRIDSQLGEEWFQGISWFYFNQAEGARAVLSTVAGSMITVAGVTFSMTLLAVSHASSQIGPRILSGFMEDKGNQITLGTFISTFVYCLLVLRAVKSGVEASATQEQVQAFVPHLAIVLALALAMMSVIVLIYFIHHVPKTISMSLAIDRVGNQLLESIHGLYPEQLKTLDLQKPEVPVEDEIEILKKKPQAICCKGRGYLMYIDTAQLMRLAEEEDLIIKIVKRPGDFLSKKIVLMEVWSHQELSEETQEKLLQNFIWGAERSSRQDVMFVVQLLSEVAIRALSPGVNDPYTAIECIHQFQAGCLELLDRKIPEKHWFDKKKSLRIIVNPIELEHFLSSIFDTLRDYVKRDLLVTEEMFRCMQTIQEVARDAEVHRLLRHHAEVLYLAALENCPLEADKKRLRDLRDGVLDHKSS